MSPRIGDTLISMVVANNLVRHGIDVTIFSAHLYALRDWFPGFRIEPALDPTRACRELGQYDVVLHAYASDVVGGEDAHPRCWVMDRWPTYRQVKPMVDIQLEICRDCFGLDGLTRDNGLVVPDGIGEVIRHRVAIHPTASDIQKQWLPQRFVALAHSLRQQGYEPCFVVAPPDRGLWGWVESQDFPLVSHASLADLASWLIRAGVFVGNDSGIAHLASNLGVPAVSLAMRPRIALRWAPGWAPSLPITAPPLMPGRWLREFSWKYLLSVGKVAAAVEKLRGQVAASPRAFGPEGGAAMPMVTLNRSATPILPMGDLSDRQPTH